MVGNNSQEALQRHKPLHKSACTRFRNSERFSHQRSRSKKGTHFKIRLGLAEGAYPEMWSHFESLRRYTQPFHLKGKFKLIWAEYRHDLIVAIHAFLRDPLSCALERGVGSCLHLRAQIQHQNSRSAVPSITCILEANLYSTSYTLSFWPSQFAKAIPENFGQDSAL